MAASIELNGYGGTDAIELASRCEKNQLPTDWLSIANRYISPVGFTPGQGSILIAKSRLDKIDLTGKLELSLTDDHGGQAFLPNIRAVGNPRCIDAGTNDPIFLLSLSDARIDVIGTTSQRYQWRFHPTDDIPLVGTDGATSLLDAIEQIWAMAPNVLGTFPGLPTNVPSPTTGAIDRLDLHGFRIADALEDLFSALGCGVSFDVTAEEDPWSIAYFPAATDQSLDVFQTWKGRLEYDADPYSPAKFGNIPALASIVFPIWPASRYGRIPRKVWIETLARPSLQWASGATLVDKIVYIQDYMPARVNFNMDVQNQAALTARAAQVGRIFFDRMTLNAPQWPIKRSYRGIIPDSRLVPGGSFDLVGWSIADGGCKTYVARSGLTAQTELYENESLTGIQTDWNPEPAVTAAGVVMRTGGTAPEIDRERSIWGLGASEPGSISLSGSGIGPYFKRGSSLRQGEWASAGTGGKTDKRGRLWRNWEDFGPDDMDRFVLVGAFDEVVGLYPCRVLRQEGRPPWPEEESAWAEGANGETLVEGWTYRAHAGTDIVQGKLVWATNCCEGSESGSGRGGPSTSAGCCPEDTPLPEALYAVLSGDCLACLPITLSMIYNTVTGKHSGSTTCTVGSCTYTYEATLQCYPCDQPPLDSACMDLDCSTESYYYCYSWTLTPSGTGCTYPAQSGTIAIPGSEVDCEDFTFEGTHNIVDSNGVPCEVTINIGNRFVGPPCATADFTTASCVMSNAYGYVAEELDPMLQQSGGIDSAIWDTLAGNDTETRLELLCGLPLTLYEIAAYFFHSCLAPGTRVPFTLSTVSYSDSPFVWVLDGTISGAVMRDAIGSTCLATDSGCRFTITIP